MNIIRISRYLNLMCYIILCKNRLFKLKQFLFQQRINSKKLNSKRCVFIFIINIKCFLKDSFGAHNSRHSSKISLHDKRTSQTHLDSSGKRHNLIFTKTLINNIIIIL